MRHTSRHRSMWSRNRRCRQSSSRWNDERCMSSWSVAVRPGRSIWTRSSTRTRRLLLRWRGQENAQKSRRWTTELNQSSLEFLYGIFVHTLVAQNRFYIATTFLYPFCKVNVKLIVFIQRIRKLYQLLCNRLACLQRQPATYLHSRESGSGLSWPSICNT